MKLSKREREILDACHEHLTAKSAALSLGLSPSTVYNVLLNIRRKYWVARKYVNTILAYRRKGPKLDMLLSRRLKLKDEEQLKKEYGF